MFNFAALKSLKEHKFRQLTHNWQRGSVMSDDEGAAAAAAFPGPSRYREAIDEDWFNFPGFEPVPESSYFEDAGALLPDLAAFRQNNPHFRRRKILSYYPEGSNEPTLLLQSDYDMEGLSEEEILRKRLNLADEEIIGMRAEITDQQRRRAIENSMKMLHGESTGRSVLFLQDCIARMDRNLHSTNEELQATLHELAESQRQMDDLKAKYYILIEEKEVLLESLFQQTDKLDVSRTRVATLQELLLGQRECSEREQKLVDMLKGAQAEREKQLLRQEELNNKVLELKSAHENKAKEASQLQERIAVLEGMCDALKAERKQLDLELSGAKSEVNLLHIDINRLNTALEHAKAKINDLECARNVKDKSELEAIIDDSRKEKDLLETQVANLQQQLSKSACQVDKQAEQIQQLMEELKVARNNAKMATSDLLYQVEQSKNIRSALTQELQEKKEHIAELQVQVVCHIDDKEQLKSVLSETQKSLVVSEKKITDLEKSLNDEIKGKIAKTAEWEQFQNDLLVTVRVANELKTEAQTQLEVLSEENMSLKDKLKSMETQIEQFQAKAPATPMLSDPTASVIWSVEQDLASRRIKTGIRKQDERLSVKNLIETIENATKQAKAGPSSKTSSTLSDTSVSGDLQAPAPLTRHYSESDLHTSTSNNNLIADAADHDLAEAADFEERRGSCSDISDRDPLQKLAKEGGSKRNALLKWCQTKTLLYKNIDITNFSTSWSDGLALCALLHSYRPDLIPYDSLSALTPDRNFAVASACSEAVGIPSKLDVAGTFQTERPEWKPVMNYITAIYSFFEG